MVLKRCKRNINTGGTIKDYTSYVTKRQQHFTNHFITKCFFRRKDTARENDNILREIEELIGVQDGGLESSRCIGTNLHRAKPFYSLNKRKRWMLLKPLKDAVDQCDEGESWKIVLHERVLPIGGASYNIKGNNTTAVHDSSLLQRHNYPHTYSSYFYDLCEKSEQQKCRNQNSSVENDTMKFKMRKKKKLGHFRGVQRPHLENCTNCQNNDREQNNRGIPGHHRMIHRDIFQGSGPGLPEVRYEVISPMKKTSEKSSYVHYGSKKWSYTCAPCKKARCKMKGLRTSQHDFFYWNGIPKWDRADEEDRRHIMDWDRDILEEDDLKILEDNAYLIESDKDTSVSISLEDFLKPSKCSRYRNRKSYYGKNISFVHPNKASSNTCVPHPKGSAIYELSSDHNVTTADEVPLNEENIGTHPTGHGTDIVNCPSVTTDIAVNDDTDFPSSQNWVVCHLKKSDYEGLVNHNSVIYEDMELTVLSSNSLPQIHALDLQPVIDMMTDSTLKDEDFNQVPTHAYMLIQKDLAGIVDWPDTSEESYESVRILLLANANQISDKLSRLQNQLSESSTMYTLSSIVNLIKEVLQECASKNNRTRKQCVQKIINDELISKICGHQVDVCSVTDAFTKVTQHSYSKSMSVTPYCEVVSIDEEYVCDICLYEVAGLQNGSNLSMIQLLPCHHSFCANCWSHHITERIRLGDTKIACQAFKCDSLVDKVTVMAVIPLDVLIQWEMRKKEKHLESTEQWKYCPNPSCSKVAKINKSGYIVKPCGVPVRCDCGEKWCYSCGKLSHWPASCQQAATYVKMLKQNGDEFGRSALVGSSTFFVEVKKCPKCKYPMEKNGGCAHMSCKCGHGFCWECLGDWSEHIGYGLVCATKRIVETTVELETSISYPLPTLYYKSSVAHRQKWHSVMNRSPKVCSPVKSYLYHLLNRPKCQYRESSATDNFTKLVIFRIQLNQILEYMYVILSNMTKTTTDGHFRKLVSQLDFIVQRIEDITSKQKPRQEDCERGEMLRSAAEKILEVLARRISKIQKSVAHVQQKILLRKADDLQIFK